MAITIREKYERHLEKMKDPVFYREFQKKRIERQRRYAQDPEFCKRRNLSTADWRFRKQRGLPVRQRINRTPVMPLLPLAPMAPIANRVCSAPKAPITDASDTFNFEMVPEISVSFD
jgi:hypothetical protein